MAFLQLWPNGWMDEDATWKEVWPRPRPHCVRWGPSGDPAPTAARPHFRPTPIAAKRSPISATAADLVQLATLRNRVPLRPCLQCARFCYGAAQIRHCWSIIQAATVNFYRRSVAATASSSAVVVAAAAFATTGSYNDECLLETRSLTRMSD